MWDRQKVPKCQRDHSRGGVPETPSPKLQGSFYVLGLADCRFVREAGPDGLELEFEGAQVSRRRDRWTVWTEVLCVKGVYCA